MLSNMFSRCVARLAVAMVLYVDAEFVLWVVVAAFIGCSGLFPAGCSGVLGDR